MLDSELGTKQNKTNPNKACNTSFFFIDILKKVHHPHVVSMHGLYESVDAVYIVTDLASGGELFNQLLDQGCYTERDAANLVRQMLEGLVYLHECDVSLFFYAELSIYE
jgi:serine/threonine protein kinase